MKATDIQNLLGRVLEAIADAATEIESEETDCGKLHYPVFRYTPSFEFTDEDIELIKQIGEEESIDLSTLTEE